MAPPPSSASLWREVVSLVNLEWLGRQGGERRGKHSQFSLRAKTANAQFQAELYFRRYTSVYSIGFGSRGLVIRTSISSFIPSST